ncbi:MAG TPA: hypothetical protein PKC49_14380, partial [Phycisphaerae bacterium]|nr:hypothetical protein [Phycisphaerae bacterium]
MIPLPRSAAFLTVFPVLLTLPGGCPSGPAGSTATLGGSPATNNGSGAESGSAVENSADPGSAPGGQIEHAPSPSLADLQVFPSDNPWNQDISLLPVHPNSAAYIATIGANTGLHPDFGTVWEGAPIGIPFNLVNSTTPRVRVSFEYEDESDPGPYPIPVNPLIEGGPNATGDRHILMLDVGEKRLYELFYAFPRDDGTWTAGSGAIFDLTSNALRPLGWTSADAAGLPIFPGLVRYDEVVERGEVTHALRFTVSRTQRGYILPA